MDKLIEPKCINDVLYNIDVRIRNAKAFRYIHKNWPSVLRKVDELQIKMFSDIRDDIKHAIAEKE